MQRFAPCLALAVALLACAHASAQTDPTYDTLVRDAVTAYEGREPERAIALFQQAFEISPSPRVLRGIAMCQIALGRWAEAHRSVQAALAIDHGARALSPELRAHVEGELLPLVRSHLAVWVLPEGVEVEVDGTLLVADEHHVVAIEPGSHAVVVVSAEGRTAAETIELRAGHIGPLPIAPLPTAPSPTVAEETVATSDTVTIVDGPPVTDRRVVIVEAPERPHLTHVIRTRFAMWAQGALGAWQGGARYVPAGGLGLTLALTTHWIRELSIGGEFEGTWAGLLDACGPYAVGTTVVRTSETCGWFQFSLRINTEVHLPDLPLSILVAAGFGVGFRSRQVPNAAGFTETSHSEAFFALDGRLRWYLVEESLFLQAEVRSTIGAFASVSGVLSLGFQVP